MPMSMKLNAALFSLLSLMGSTAMAAEPPPLPVEAAQRHMGVASCANSLCHGAVISHENSNIAHTEYTTWARKDPHSQTYRDLFSDDFIAITRKLGLKPPHKEPVCLACHGSNVKPQFRDKKFSMEDGIGCETCHGGAEKYLSTHTAEGVTRAQNIRNGLYPTDDMIARTRLCLSCHYGTTDQFVTHEIMGAGHPRISFELDTFSELLNPHVIYDADYRARKPIYSHVKMWALGQAVAAESMLKMIDDKHMLAAGLFPELSLFDCHSCHHPMSKKTWQKKQGTGLGPGAVPFNDSNLLMLRLVLKQIAPALGSEVSDNLQRLHAASNSSEWVTKKIAARLRDQVAKAITLVDRHQFTPQQTVELAKSLISTGIAGDYEDYIAAEQCVMGIGALVAAWNDIKPFDDGTTKLVSKLMDQLFNAVANDENFVPEQFEGALAQLKSGLKF